MKRDAMPVPHLPPMSWLILALGVTWMVARLWAAQSDARRRAASEERLEKLLAEREAGPEATDAEAHEAGATARESTEEKARNVDHADDAGHRE